MQHYINLSLEIYRELREHIQSLGLLSISSYKLWCKRHGLPFRIDKSSEEFEEERLIAQKSNHSLSAEVSRDHDPSRARLIESIFRGERNAERLTNIPTAIRRLYLEIQSNRESCEALRRLVLHVEKFTCFMRTMSIFRGYGKVSSNTCLDALLPLARRHADWCRPLEEWRPQGHKMRMQFSSLVSHLLAKYPIPPCMDSAWFQGDTPESRVQQEWVVRVGRGESLRRIGIPMTISKRMAHLFMQSNSRHHTLIQMLRFVQLQALGSPVKLCWNISGSRMGQALENEEFWLSVIHFFVNQYEMLEPSYIDPIIDYIHNQKFEPAALVQEDGSVVMGEPEQPNFSMKSRRADRLLRLVDEWHDRLGAEESRDSRVWPSQGFQNFSFEERDEELGERLCWSVHELTSSAQLGVEGRIMRHCVASYTERCMKGELSLWSLRLKVLDCEEEEERRILTIAVDNRSKTVNQARGKYNMNPNDKLKVSRRRKADRPYLHRLRESLRILRLWREQVGLGQTSM